MPQRETMEYDVVIVGAGPAGLSCAIRLKQLAQQQKKELRVCIVEKGATVGAHILSGAVLEPRALNELFPNWQQKNAPLTTPVIEDRFLFLTEKKAFRLPTPPQMKNHGNFIISLGQFCRWLAQQAEELGVEIYPGFAAVDVLYNEQQEVIGIATGDMGLDKQDNPTAHYQPGMALLAKQTVFAEGCRGSLAQQLIAKFQLRDPIRPQTYGIGLKELWEIDPKQHYPGRVIHTIGWPLDQKTYGGSFIYHLNDHHQLAIGFVIGLDYQNPFLNPYQELQRFKLHPAIRPLFENAKRIGYGARAINEGGWQAIPKLSFPGGLLIGCAAGFLNVPKIKGTHTAMKSGMLAAETIFATVDLTAHRELITFNHDVKHSWIGDELYRTRNIRPSFNYGLWAGLLYSAMDTYVFRGEAPWTFKHRADHQCLKLASQSTDIPYPKADGKVTFDKMSSVFLTNVNHEENQPCHLQLKNPALAIEINYRLYHSPETRYCPAGVYEIVQGDHHPKLQINAQNCIHCKTCDIKDPKQNIRWVPPEGGDGPNYGAM